MSRTIEPTGAIVEEIAFDDEVPTIIAFGGPDLRTAFVTLSSTGRLVAYDCAVPGLSLAFGV